jgi:hypothetical protein
MFCKYSDKFIRQIQSYETKCTNEGKRLPNEHLYGRAGYLYTLQYLQEELPLSVFEKLQWNLETSMKNLWDQVYQQGLHQNSARK